MLGHEHARDLVRAHLEQSVPVELAGIRTRLGVTAPTDPAAYLLADGFPMDATKYPVVVIQSTEVTGMQAVSTAADEWLVEYEVQIVGGCRASTAGGYEDASRQRDRLMLAIRQAVMRHHGLGDDGEADIVTTSLTDRVGEGSQDVQGRPLSAGVITVRVRVIEPLDATGYLIDSAQVDVDPVTTDPTADIDPTPPPPEE